MKNSTLALFSFALLCSLFACDKSEYLPEAEKPVASIGAPSLTGMRSTPNNLISPDTLQRRKDSTNLFTIFLFNDVKGQIPECSGCFDPKDFKENFTLQHQPNVLYNNNMPQFFTINNSGIGETFTSNVLKP